MANTLPAEFLGTHLDIIERDGQRWLTAEQVGLALGYQGRASDKVRTLYRRHKEEFLDSDKGDINLMSPGGEQSSIIFSASGCILLSFFANTSRAAQFRAWAKETLAAQLNPAPIAPAPRKGWFVMTRALERQVLEMFCAGWKIAQIAKTLKISSSIVSQTVHGKYQFSPGAGTSLCTPELIEAVARQHLVRERERLMEAHARLAGRLRSTANNAALAHTLDRVGIALQGTPAAVALIKEDDLAELLAPEVPNIFRSRRDAQ